MGGRRGRLISASDRKIAIKLIAEAVKNGAREKMACKEIGISQRTLERWLEAKTLQDQRQVVKRPVPKNKLTKEERHQILEVVNEERFQSLPPGQIVPALADEGRYIASESTFYRVLREHNQQNHRGYSAAPNAKNPSTHSATGPNQVWMWDITWLPGAIRGQFYYLYLIIDLFSRKIIAWEIWLEESAEHASQLVRRAVLSEKLNRAQKPLVLHSDNGSPMKGATLLATLYGLGITPSNSRPRVSNDNAYAEAIFRTCKYRPNYPSKGFSSLEDAREWVLNFTKWYNYEHKHSGIKFITPVQRHNGQYDLVMEKRKQVYEQAKAKNPERWSRSTRNWTLPDEVWLNPERTKSEPENGTEIAS